jgi:hypothetical protein
MNMKLPIFALRVILSLVAAAAALSPAPAAAGEAAAPAAPVILDEGSWWRSCMVWKTPVVRVGQDLVEFKGYKTFAQLPPASWMQADFDDSLWSRYRLSRTRSLELDGGFYGATFILPSISRHCLRGRFLVDDPARVQDMKLSVAYRGGAVVYLNGKEIARGHLTKDAALDEKALAEDYPPEAFLKADNKPIMAGWHDPEKNRDRVEKRFRRLENISIPASALRKGINILALDIVRAPYSGPGLAENPNGPDSVWAPCGLISLKLTAAAGATPNTGRPSGFQVWNLDSNDRVKGSDCGDSAEPLKPIVLVGVRNGTFSGQVVASSAAAIKGLKAEVSAGLKGPGTIPASAVQVRYARMDGALGDYRAVLYADSLADQAPGEVPVNKDAGVWIDPSWATTKAVAVQQILVTVRVPKDAAPGNYQGALTVSAAGVAPVTVPIELRVADWTLPDPQNFRTFVCLYQSPTTVATQYKVPEWSEEHWKYLEKSFELLGRIGNKAIHVPVVDKTQLGNDEGMVFWIKKEDGSFDYDFSVFERYLKLAKKHCGQLDYVVLYVWHSLGWGNKGTDQENTVTVIDKKTGARSRLQVPVFATEESKKFWTPVLLGLKERLSKEGMEKAFCLGSGCDGFAPKEVFQMFHEIIPDVGWHRGCHGMSPPQPYYCFKDGKAGVGKVTYHEHCYGLSLPEPGKPFPPLHTLRGNPGTTFCRGDFDSTAIYPLHMMAERALFYGKQGIGRMGLDFWLGTSPGGENGTIYNRWPRSTSQQRAPSVFRLSSPGPDGALANLRFEAMLEGVQEAEALIVASEAADKHPEKIGKELADRIHALILERLNILGCQDFYLTRGWTGNFTQHTGWQDCNARLFAAAAEAAGKLR